MTHWRTQRRVALAIGLGAHFAAGCSAGRAESRTAAADTATRTAIVRRLAVNDHGGIKLDARIAPMMLSCDDGRRRMVAPSHSTQLITFTSPGDCSACQPHLAGLDSLSRRGELPFPHVYVAYSGAESRSADRRAYAAVVRGPVCWDERGTLWDRHDISHTPVTAVVVGGVVLLLHDTPLVSAEARRQFLDSLRVLKVY